MNPLEDPLVQKMILRKDISSSRIRLYGVVLEDYCEITGLSPTELIMEAKEDQTPYLNKKNQIIFKDEEERKIAYYLQKYNKLLEDKKIKKSSRRLYLQAIRSFYTEYNIKLPKHIKITVPKVIIREGTIPNINDIRTAIESTSNLRNKAIILLMATSGIRTVDIREFTIGDFTQATKEYHEGNNVYDLLDMKDKHIENIIPAWYFIPSKTDKEENKNVCLTFNTPECTEHIIRYLRSREDLQETDPLFKARDQKMGRNTYAYLFEHINDSIFEKIDSTGHRFFRAHNLRKFFLSQYRQKTNDSFNLRLVAGHSLPGINDENYQELPIQPSREVYMKVIPSLTIRDTQIHSIKSKEYLKLEKQLEEKDQKYTQIKKTQDNIADQFTKILEFAQKDPEGFIKHMKKKEK